MLNADDDRPEVGVYVASSPIHGTGVFAAEHFVPGEVVLQIDDSRVVNAENPLRPSHGEFQHHCDYLAGGLVVLMAYPERHINSSCDPTTFVKSIGAARCVVARRRIIPGEEITYDYILNCHGGAVWECSCASERCRKTIVSSFFELPLAWQIEYLPLLDHWFLDEHTAAVQQLKDRAAAVE